MCVLTNNLLPIKSPKKKNSLRCTFNFHYYKLYSRLSVGGLSGHDRKFLMTNDECEKWRDLVSSVRTKCSVQTKITEYLRKTIIVSSVCIMHTVNKSFTSYLWLNKVFVSDYPCFSIIRAPAFPVRIIDSTLFLFPFQEQRVTWSFRRLQQKWIRINGGKWSKL
jgi:hypothetical protein